MSADLEAKQAITEVLYRYCRSMDRIDNELGYAVWHPDGTALYSGIFEGTGRGFIDWVSQLHTGMVATSHQISNILIELTGASAVSESYVTVRLRSPDGQGGHVDIVGAGRYLDRWSNRRGVWAIDHRDYLGDLTTTIPVPPGDVSVPKSATVPVLASQPNTEDPSYQLFANG